MSAIVVKVARQQTPRKGGIYPSERLHRGLRAQQLTHRLAMLSFGASPRFDPVLAPLRPE